MCFFHLFYHHLTKILEIETAVIRPKYRSGHPSKTNKINSFFSKKIIVNQYQMIILHISKSKPKAKISYKMLFSHVNVGSAQWTLYGAVGFVSTTIKIMWSIGLDENNDIGPRTQYQRTGH